ncbi:hypothetical protein Gotur_024194, partial [Gossypium turneri]
MTTLEYHGWWAKRINDNTSKFNQEDSQSIEEHLRVIPSELEIIRQDFGRKNADLEKKIEQMEEEKTNLRLDIDVQKLETEKLRKEKNKAEEELEEKDKVDRWEQKFQEMQRRNEALEKSLSESQKEKGELKDRVIVLERSLRQYRSRNSTIELKASLSKIEEMKERIEELEMIREVADYIQTLAVQADMLSMKYELESDRGQELALLLRKIRGSMMAKLTQLLTGGVDKGKGTVLNIEEGDNEGLVYSSGLTSQQVEIYPRKSSVTIKPKDGSVTPINFQARLGSNPGDNLANP